MSVFFLKPVETILRHSMQCSYFLMLKAQDDLCWGLTVRLESLRGPPLARRSFSESIPQQRPNSTSQDRFNPVVSVRAPSQLVSYYEVRSPELGEGQCCSVSPFSLGPLSSARDMSSALGRLQGLAEGQPRCFCCLG